MKSTCSICRGNRGIRECDFLDTSGKFSFSLCPLCYEQSVCKIKRVNCRRAYCGSCKYPESCML